MYAEFVVFKVPRSRDRGSIDVMIDMKMLKVYLKTMIEMLVR